MSDMRSIVRGWLDLLREPDRVRASKEALDKALAEAEARGFKRAKEMAERLGDDLEGTYERGDLDTAGIVDYRDRIRAMQDGQGQESTPKCLHDPDGGPCDDCAR